jgi:hypothetical protein
MKHEFKAIPKEEPKQQLGGIPKGRIDMVVGKSKQETLEEAAEKWFKEIGGEASFMKAIEFGAKWQQEQDNNKLSELAKFRNELYEQLPTGKVNAFDLIKIINNHINRIDELI